MADKQCEAGYSCGSTCINRDYSCGSKLGEQSSEKAGALADSASGANKAKRFSVVTDRQEVLAELHNAMQTPVFKAANALPRKAKDSDAIAKISAEFGIDFNAKPAKVRLAAAMFGGIAESAQNENTASKFKLLKSGGKVAAATSYFVDADTLTVNYLATSPENFTSTGTKGAGTQAIALLIDESIAQGKKGRLKLTPTPSAVSFYEKVGFTTIADDGTDMMLSPANAKRFMQRTAK